MIRLFSLLLFSFLATGALFADPPWASVSVPQAEETSALLRLKGEGIEAVARSNAVVEVSAFEGLEMIPLADLSRRLTPQDPRWDPWLKGLGAWFEPKLGLSRIWVPASSVSEARRILGPLEGTVSSAKGGSALSPPVVTGSAMVAFAVLFLGLSLAAGLQNGWPPAKPRSWLGVFLSVLVLSGGFVLLRIRGEGDSAPAPVSSVSWLQHRWFQETWPWGATWSDYKTGRAWSYRSYEHRQGRLTEVPTSLKPADSAWAGAAWAGLPPLHAARIFGSEIP